MRDMNQDGIFLPMSGKLRPMLADLRRHRQLSGAGGSDDDAHLVMDIIEKAHKDLLEELGYDPNEARASANISRINNASTAAMAGVSELDKVSAAFGRPPGWVESQERLSGITQSASPGTSSTTSAGSGREHLSRGVYGG